MSVLEQALALAAGGLPVFPCHGNKSPACAWSKAATRDPETIRALFAGGAPLIGVPTGEASGLDALDLDPRNGSDAWWDATQSTRCIPYTRIHTTRSGGKHLVFRHQPGLRCSVNRLAPGCDVRADGGFIIWWPAAGFDVWLDEDPMPWPDWALAGLAIRTAAAPDPSRLDPPSAAAVVALMNRLPNPLELGRDEYASVMLAASWCAHASGDDDGAIADAAVAWAER